MKYEVESVMKNLVKDSDSESRTSLHALNDIRKAVTNFDLGAVLITNSICTTFIPKFPISPLNSAVALVCYS